MVKAFLVITLVSCLATANATDLTPAQGFNSGSDMATQYLGNQFLNKPHAINSGTATSHLPTDYYGTTPTATHGLDAVGLYGGGIGDLLTPGVQRNADCMAMTGNPDHKEQIPCDAVKTVHGNDKGGFVFSKNDPMLVKSKQAYNDPLAVLGAAGMEFNVTERACAPGTTAVPTTTETRVCSEVMTATPGSCQPFEDVQIDRLANFKCKQSQNPLEHPNCEKTLDVVVNVNYSCPPNTWIEIPAFETYTKLEYYCDIDPSNPKLKLRFTPQYLHGICQIGNAEVPKAPFTVTGTSNIEYNTPICDSDGNCLSDAVVKKSVAHFIHHWKGGCTVGQAVTYAAGAQGCVGDVCTYSFRVIETGAGNSSSPGGIYHNTNVLNVHLYGPRWGNIYQRTAGFPLPKKIVSTTQSWINQCVAYEARMAP